MNKQRLAEFYMLLVTIVWGSTFVVTKAIIPDNSPLFYTGIRFVFAALIVIALFPRRSKGIPGSTILHGSVLGALLFIGFALQTAGMQFTTASKSAFLTGLMVVLTPIVQWIATRFFHAGNKSLRIGNLVGVVFAAIGLYLLTSPSGGQFNIGDLMTLACAVCFAVYVVYLDAAASGEPDKLQLTLVQFLLCGLLGFLSAGFFEDVRVELSARFFISLTYLTVFATVIAMWVQNRYQGDTTPTRAAVVFSMEPVVAGIMAYFIRDEYIGTVGVIGAGTILTGLALSEFSEEFPILRAVVGADSASAAEEQ